MTDFTDLAHRYIDAWNETDSTKRRALIEQLFTEDASYTDPLGSVRGWDEIDHFIAGAQGKFAGLVFSLPGAVDGHHDTARFSISAPRGLPSQR